MSGGGKPNTAQAQYRATGPDVWYDCSPFGFPGRTYRVRLMTGELDPAHGGGTVSIPVVDFPEAGQAATSGPTLESQLYSIGVPPSDPTEPAWYLGRIASQPTTQTAWHRLPCPPSASKIDQPGGLDFSDYNFSSAPAASPLEFSGIPDLQGLDPGRTSLSYSQVTGILGGISTTFYIQQAYPASRIDFGNVIFQEIGADLWVSCAAIGRPDRIYRVRMMTGVVAGTDRSVTIPVVDFPSTNQTPTAAPSAGQVSTLGVCTTSPADPATSRWYLGQSALGPSIPWHRPPGNPGVSQLIDPNTGTAYPTLQTDSAIHLTQLVVDSVPDLQGLNLPNSSLTFNELSYTLGGTCEYVYLQQPYPAS